MIIGIDVDSVLADLMIPLNEFHNRHYGTSLKVDDYLEYNLGEFWGCADREVLNRVYRFYDSPYMDTIPLIEGAREGIDYLKNKGHELIVITSRPTSIETATVRWLNAYFPDTFEDIILSNQFSKDGGKKRTKGQICKEEGIEALIDDHIDYAIDASENGLTAYLFEAPWNRHKIVPEPIIRLPGWHAISNYF